LAWTILHPH